uniref:Myocardin related transcription factor B n=1 Tax=Cyclopterus lumpus TaxID=8103 RepID=A0A8C2WNZ0_CYCLU
MYYVAALKSPAAFHGQIRSLERARTENFLKHKIRSRPERAELVRMHILQETGAEPSLQATQMKLKRARLADNLNEKLAQRPGPMELVEKNILPVDSSVKKAIIVGQVNYPKVLDEDSCDALSPEHPASQEPQSCVASPAESKVPETPSLVPAPPTPNTLLQQSQPKSPSEKSRSKKGKEPKSRVKKLKYHQYVPPDQKLEASEAPMDSSYARLLQQQQLFLQLQILSQQQQHYNYQTILPAPLKYGQSGSAGSLPTSIMVSLPTAPPPPSATPALTRPSNSLSNRKPGVLPANLEEMKVAELKLELKLRGLPVSGTKTDLIERLKPFQDNHCTSAPTTIPVTTLSSMSMDVTTTSSPAIVLPVQQVAPENMNPTPPVSPITSDRSTLQQDLGMSETQMLSSGWAGSQSSPLSSFRVPEEKDRRLHEKEQQIVELMKKLEQEQRLVEELKMQLEVEKRGQGGCTTDSASPKLNSVPTINPVLTALSSNVVKMEGSCPSPQPTFILQPTSLVTRPPKTREPPRYEEAIKQSRNLHVNSVSQVRYAPATEYKHKYTTRTMFSVSCSAFLLMSSLQSLNLVHCLFQVPTATSQQMDDLFDILIEITANISTLSVNTALSRPPPQIQSAPPPTLSPLIGLGLSTSDPRTRGLMEELQAQLMEQQPYSPMDTSDLSFCDSSSPSSLNMGLSDPGLDNMEWMDLSLPPGPAGALTPLGIPTDFLDSQDLQLHWD